MGFFDDIGDAFTDFGNAIADVGRQIGGGFNSIGDGAQTAIHYTETTIAPELRNVVDDVTGFVVTLPATLTNLVQGGCTHPPPVPATQETGPRFDFQCEGNQIPGGITMDAAVSMAKRNVLGTCTNDSWSAAGCSGSFKTICTVEGDQIVIHQEDHLPTSQWTKAVGESVMRASKCNGMFLAAKEIAKCESDLQHFIATPACQADVKNSDYRYNVEMAGKMCAMPEHWSSEFCKNFCDKNVNNNNCHAGFDKYCGGGDNKWLPGGGTGTDDTCWNYAKKREMIKYISDKYQNMCSVLPDPAKPGDKGALNNRACFSDNSYACAIRGEGQPFQQGNRYDWCSDTVQILCEAANFDHPLCACSTPFTVAESSGLSEVGVAANRYCFGGAAGSKTQELHQQCRAVGYVLNPAESCQSVCAVVNQAINFANITVNNSAPTCGNDMQPRLVNYPGDRDTVATWSAWWAKNGNEYSDSTIPSLLQFAQSFSKAIANSSSLAEVQSVASFASTIPSLPARTIIAAAANRRITALTPKTPTATKQPVSNETPDDTPEISETQTPQGDPNSLKTAWEKMPKNQQQLVVGGGIATILIIMMVCMVMLLMMSR